MMHASYEELIVTSKLIYSEEFNFIQISELKFPTILRTFKNVKP